MGSGDDIRTVGLVRRAVAILFDASFGAAATAVGYAVGLFDASPFSPPPDWFWTEWWLRHWLDSPAVFIVPLSFFLIASILWTVVWEATTGRTPGDRVMGMRVIDGAGDRPGPLRMGARTAGIVLNIASLGLGWLWVAVSPARRGWHELLSGTYTVVNRDD